MRHGCKTGQAKALRRRMTDAERLLWFRLRDRRLLGCKFRRQWPIGPYVVDFACVEHALAIEIDGSQHLDSASDKARDACLRGKGYSVLRFWNNEVLAGLDAVCETIAQRLAADRRFLLPPETPEDPAEGR